MTSSSSAAASIDYSESSSEHGAAASLPLSRTSSVASVLGNTPQSSALHEKYLGFISRSSRYLQLAGPMATANQQPHGEMKETAQLMQRIIGMLTPQAGASAARLVADLSREMVQQFGYAVAESGQTRAAEIIEILLLYLQPSGRTRTALKYLRDGQVERIIGDPPQAATGCSAALGSGGSGGGSGAGHSSVHAELRRIDVALQLLYSVVSFGDSYVASAAATGSAGGKRHGMRLDRAMLPSLKHLFDLLIVARPISDSASRVLHILLQRFDEFGGSASAQPWGVVEGGSERRVRWFESDPLVLLDAARRALSRVVAFGVGQEDDGSSGAADIGTDDDETASYIDMDMVMPRSVSPEMPVLVIPGESTDDVRVERLALRDSQLRADDGRCSEESVGDNRRSLSDSTPYAEHLDENHRSSIGGDFGSLVSSSISSSSSAAAYASESISDESDDGDGDGDGNDDEDLLAQLDEFDKVLDEALLA
ncbi:hypothetical protein GQ54DRAFT_298191 [Martensiomyces pterosporus]|nr:hypothetical protein GQ54DRAFT_298191 [Martensiomyces pterosporus]